MSADRRARWAEQLSVGPGGPRAPWGTTEPDPPVVEAVRSGRLVPGQRVLDLGAGTGSWPMTPSRSADGPRACSSAPART